MFHRERNLPVSQLFHQKVLTFSKKFHSSSHSFAASYVHSSRKGRCPQRSLSVGQEFIILYEVCRVSPVKSSFSLPLSLSLWTHPISSDGISPLGSTAFARAKDGSLKRLTIACFPGLRNIQRQRSEATSPPLTISLSVWDGFRL